MIGRRAVIGASILCALAVSAFTAVSASAAPSGTRSFTCAKVGVPGTFKDAHCLQEEVTDPGYTHVPYTKKTAAVFPNSNVAQSTTASQPAILKSTVAGVKTAIECTTVGGSGTIENVASGEESWVSGTATVEYSGCTVTEPAGKGCVVKGGKFITNELTATTKGQGMGISIAPTTGTTISEITIEKCSIGALNSTFAVTGSIPFPISGPTLIVTDEFVTAANTLKFGGQKAGLDGAVTVTAGANGTGLTVTTPPYLE